MSRNLARRILERILGWRRAWDILSRFEGGGLTIEVKPGALARCPVPITLPLDSVTGIVGIEPEIEWLALGEFTVNGRSGGFVTVHFEKAVAMFVTDGIGLVVHRDADLEEVSRWLETVVWPRARARQGCGHPMVESSP